MGGRLCKSSSAGDKKQVAKNHAQANAAANSAGNGAKAQAAGQGPVRPPLDMNSDTLRSVSLASLKPGHPAPSPALALRTVKERAEQEPPAGMAWLEEELGNVEWLVPEPCEEETAAIEEVRANANIDQQEKLKFALKSLWRNWIDGLELALGLLEGEQLPDNKKLDVELMTHKLEFTRIRQHVVEQAREYVASQDLKAFQAASRDLVARCQQLAARQPEDVFSPLPSIIPRRDTMMLESRIVELTRKIAARHAAKPKA